MLETQKHAPFALALLAATCLTPVSPAQAAPGDALGPVFQVSTPVTHRNGRSPAVAMDADGDFVVTWLQYFDGTGIYGSSEVVARRYDAAGAVKGDKIQVSTSTGGSKPSVALAADGDFVVVWENGQVFARRFNVRDQAEGPEFQVNTRTGGTQPFPSVAMDADGDFVVAWTNKDGDSLAILAQRYDASGEPQGGEFEVTTTVTGWWYFPSLAMDADGNFVVAWNGYGPGDTHGIFARLYSASGEPQGGEFQVNTTTTGEQEYASVAMDADGDFVVVWSGERQPGRCDLGEADVFAQRYDSLGNPLGGEVPVNSTARSSYFTRVAMDADGDFVVVWDQYCETGDATFIVRRFDAAANPRGGEVRIDAHGGNYSPVVAMDSAGDHVVAWAEFHTVMHSDGWARDVFAQRFQGPGLRAGDFDIDGKADILWHNAASGAAVLWRMDGFARLAAEPAGSAAAPWGIAGIADFTGETKADVLWRNAETGATVLWQMDGATKVAARLLDTVPPAWRIEGLGDLDGDGHADILWRNAATGNAIAWLMDGFVRTAAQSIGHVAADWTVAGIADFDGDAKADLLWRNAATGVAVVWLMDGDTKLEVGSIGTVPSAWQIAGTGDFNGDGKADVFWRNSATGNAIVWQMNGFEKTAAEPIGTVPLAWTVERLRDTNGDGLSDIVWRNTGTGATVVWRMSGFTKVAAEAIGSVPSDWDLY